MWCSECGRQGASTAKFCDACGTPLGSSGRSLALPVPSGAAAAAAETARMVPQGAGWWQASDGQWYPPESHANYRPTPPPRSVRKTLSLRGGLALLICLLYIVSPVDFFPEVLLGPIGLTDDVIVALGVARKLWSLRARQDVVV